MKSLAYLLIALALLSPAYAVDYWFIAGEDVNDVLVGANFAAHMKATEDVSFQGMIMEEAANQAMHDGIVDKVVVYLDDGNAVLMAAPAYDGIFDTAEPYLENQGYRVDRQEPNFELLGVVDEPEEERPVACPADAKLCWDGTAVGRDLENCEIFLPCPPEPVEEPVEQIDPPSLQLEAGPEDILEKKPNVVVRVWRWFAGLFS